MTSFSDRYGPWSVVTGAAAGVGLAFTEELTARGVGVVMVDISPDVGDVGESLTGPTRPLVADVADPTWIEALGEVTVELEIGMVVANAGISHVGHYLDMDATLRRRILDVNCAATADLASWALPGMVERGRGGFVATSSGSALAGTAGVAFYSATKAFVVNLVEAIGHELRDTGVDTLAIVAPAMDTQAFRASDADYTQMLEAPVDPRPVVANALDALPEGGRWLADPGLELAATLDRRELVDMMGTLITSMYPRVFDD